MVGTLLIYYGANYLVDNNLIKVNDKMRILGSYCFGVYIFQEPILKILYYKTNYIFMFSSDIVPIVAFVIALITSIALTHLILKTQIGRILIG